MRGHEARLTRARLLDYFVLAATPRAEWKVGMELELMGRRSSDGRPIPHDGDGPSVVAVLRKLLDRRGGGPVLEAEHLIGVDGPWGTISLEPGGQVEWSSLPAATLTELATALEGHLAALREVGAALGVDWLEEALDPVHGMAAMPWMPKARYEIMRPYLGARGRLAHRMMTQTASIQCAFDYESPEDWRDKFRAAALLSPVATALFANSPRMDGRDTGHRCYRQAIWRETDPERCGLPPVVFDAAFDLGAWLDYVIGVPTIFLHRAGGLVPAGGVAFDELMRRPDPAVRLEDWETHVSTIFTDVRSYNYIEVRTADVQPLPLSMAVPTLWTGILYQREALDAGLRLGRCVDGFEAWSEAMVAAARDGLDGVAGGRPLRELAQEAVDIAVAGLRNGAACVVDVAAGIAVLGRLAARHGMTIRA